MSLFRSIRHLVWMSCNLVAVAVLLLAVLSVHIPPEKAHLISMLGVAFEPLIYVNLFFVISWLFTHRKTWSLVSVLALLCSAPAILSTWSHPFNSPNSSPKVGEVSEGGRGMKKLTVLSYNTHLLQSHTPMEDNELLRYVKNSGADVVCMQEYAVYKDRHYPTFNAVKRFLTDVYPYTYFDFAIHNRRIQYGLAVYSKYPLIHKQTIRLETQGNGANYCDIVCGPDTIRLFNNHLQSNSLLPADIDSMLSLHGTIPAKLPNAYAKRSVQVRAVRAEIDRSPYPVIVCGDFNDVPVSYTYHTLSRGLSDAFLDASQNLSPGHTYVRRGIGIRIDYILTSPALHATDFHIDKVSYSDHYPVTATLCW